jgi:hypothetical protein
MGGGEVGWKAFMSRGKLSLKHVRKGSAGLKALERKIAGQ